MCAVPKGGEIKSKGNSLIKKKGVKGIHLLKRKVCCTKKRSDQFIWEFLNKICEERKKERKNEKKKRKENKRK